MDIFTPIIGAIASVFKKKALEDNSRTKSDDSSADASGKSSVAVGKVGGDLTINPPPALIPPERVDVPKHTYDESLKNAVTAKALELQIEHDKKTALLQAELNELKNRQNDPEKALQEEAEFKAKIKADLEREGNEAGAEKMAEAQDALEKGDFSKAIEFFTEIKKREELGEQRSARASFALGEIAEQEIRFKDAAEHYARAAQLAPCFDTLIIAQRFALDVANYDSALSLGLATKKAAIAEYGKESKEYATSLNSLAAIYHQQEQYKKAEPLYQQIVKIHQKILSKNDPVIALGLNNLAECYRDQGLYKEAEPLYLQAIEICKKRLGKKHPNTASSISNLALLYCQHGFYEKAEPLINEALKIRQKTLSKNHPDIANSLNSLALFYEEKQQYEEANVFYLQALKMIETTLGHEHIHTKFVRDNYERNKKLMSNAENDESQ